MSKDRDDIMFVAAQAYQVIGALAAEAGLFEHPEVKRALDYFNGIANRSQSPREDFLPWFIPDTDRTPSVPILWETE